MTADRTPRGSQTRESILEAAELLFAERGFATTRLEDVAEQVGIRRASIVYHFRDKRELYDAVLEELVQGMLRRLGPVLTEPGPLRQRVEDTISEFVDFLAERPTIARILLREVADAQPGEPMALVKHTLPFYDMVRGVVNERMPGPPRFPKAEPIQLASVIAGTTVFFIVAVPTIVPMLQLDPLQPEALESLKAELRSITVRLLGEPTREEDRP